MVSGLGATVGPFSKNIAASDSRAVVCQQRSGTFVLSLGLGPVLLLPGDAGQCDVRSDSGKVRATGTARLNRLVRARVCEVQLSASKRELRICFGDIGRQSRIAEAFRARTAWAATDGVVNFREDIYKLDGLEAYSAAVQTTPL